MYLNAQNTFNELLDMGVIPIVNENDTIAVSEIKFGDNDTLSAITAAMVHADILFLMTDVDCLYDKNPRTNPDAQPIEVIDDIDALEADGEIPRVLAAGLSEMLPKQDANWDYSIHRWVCPRNWRHVHQGHGRASRVVGGRDYGHHPGQ